MPLRKVLVANRGEIAVRIIRAAKELGLATVQVYSKADADMLAVRMADEAVEIGPPHPAKSYLKAEAILKAAQDTGADAIHPGYGFLSENADFAAAVEAAGLTFVGPSAETIRTMGDKAAARASAIAAGVPVVPGSDGVITDLATAPAIAERIGYPVMIKATAGGGGRGIRVAENADQLATLLPQAAQEARAAFGNGAPSTSSASSAAHGMSRCRCSATAKRPSTCMSANARSSDAARRCGRRRLPACCLRQCGMLFAHRPCASPWPAATGGRARSNICTTKPRTTSSSSR